MDDVLCLSVVKIMLEINTNVYMNLNFEYQMVPFCKVLVPYRLLLGIQSLKVWKSTTYNRLD